MSYQEIACLVLKTNVLTTDGTTNAYVFEPVFPAFLIT